MRLFRNTSGLGLWVLNYLAAVGYMMYFIHKHAVDFLILDRLATWRLVLLQDNWWTGFTAQMGTHRHGLMYVFSKCAHFINPNNTTVDFYLNGLILATIPAMLYYLKRKIKPGFDLIDFIIPWIVLSVYQWETLLINPYTHVMLPFFIVVGMLVFQIKNITLKTVLAILCIFFSAFSTFAVFFTPIFAILLCIQYWKENHKLSALLIAFILLATLFVFFVNYDFSRGATGTEQSLIISAQYLIYWISYYLDLGYLNYGHYTALLLLFYLSLQLYRNRISKEKILLLLMGLLPLLIFGFALGYGRNNISSEIMTASRYISAALPLIYIIYLFVYPYHRQIYKAVNVIILTTLSIIVIRPFFNFYAPSVHQRAEYMQKVKEVDQCVSESEDWQGCTDKHKFQFYFEKQAEYAGEIYRLNNLSEQ